MVHGMSYVEEGLKKHEERVLQTETRWLRKLAKKHGMVLAPKAA